MHNDSLWNANEAENYLFLGLLNRFVRITIVGASGAASYLNNAVHRKSFIVIAMMLNS